MRPLALLWLDLETTGSEETEGDEIIEIGAILSDFDFELFPGNNAFSIVVRPTSFAFKRMLENDVVREMHTKNGLLKDVREAETDIHLAELKMLDWLNGRDLNHPHCLRLAGSGVGHFDRRFIKKYMPALDEVLVRAPLDIGSVRRFMRMTGVLPSSSGQDPKDHRAFSDAALHLKEAQHYEKIVRTGPYPREDGDFVIIGPETFKDSAGTVISHQGENYYANTESEEANQEADGQEAGQEGRREGQAQGLQQEGSERRPLDIQLSDRPLDEHLEDYDG
jgi:oligoribonuclease